MGVKSLALFGSAARDEATGRSDGDPLVELDRPIGLFGLFALQDHLETVCSSAFSDRLLDAENGLIRMGRIGEQPLTLTIDQEVEFFQYGHSHQDRPP